MGKIGKVLKPKQHTEKHHKPVAAYEQREQSVSATIQEENKRKK